MIEQVKKRIAELESDTKCLEKSNSCLITQTPPQLSSSAHEDGTMNTVKPVMHLSSDNLARWDELEGYLEERKGDEDVFDTQSIAQSVLSKAGQSTRLVTSLSYCDYILVKVLS